MPLVAHFLKTQRRTCSACRKQNAGTRNFRSTDFRALGYEHIAINGQKGYHGVAIVLEASVGFVEKRDFCEKGDARHICVEIDAAERPIIAA